MSVNLVSALMRNALAEIAEVLFQVAEKMFSAAKFSVSESSFVVVKTFLLMLASPSAKSIESGKSLPMNRISDIGLL